MTTTNSDSSVISTGGGGTVFEQQVGGSFLSLVLAGSYVPIFPDAVATKVHFQARRLGWKIDDLLLEAVTNGESRHAIAAQVKRTFVVSDSDDDCRKTFIAAWQDFHATNRFDPSKDAIALIVHLGTNRILGDLGWLLAQARISTSAQDFLARRTTEGLLNKRSKADYETIKSILEKNSETGVAVSDDNLWLFLKIFYILSYDLTSSSAKDESWIRNLLSITTTEGNPASAATATWAELIKLAAEGAAHGASYERVDLPPTIIKRHRSVGSAEHHSIVSIRQHSEIILNRIADAAPTGLSFKREQITDQLRAAASSNRIVFIVGSAGSGKSVLAKRYIRSLSRNEFAIVFAAEEFRVPHIDSVFTNANIGVNWAAMRSLLCMQPSKTILLEGLERLLETEDRSALVDLLKAAQEDPTIRLLITCRDYHAETVERAMLLPSGISFQRVVVPELTDNELTEAIKICPSLERPLSSLPLRRLLRNAFMLSRAAEISWSSSASLPATEKALREKLWGDIVRKDIYPGDGMPNRRALTLINISLSRARSLRPFVEVQSFDHQATHALAVDNLLAFDSSDRLRAAPAHDVLEDWALIDWLISQFKQFDGDFVEFAKSRDAHPALRRAYRKWLHEVIETDAETANNYLTSITAAVGIADYLRDDTMIAIFQSSAAAIFLDTFAIALLSNEGFLIQRAIHLIRVACKTVSPLASNSAVIHRWHVPTGSAWPNMLEFLSKKWTDLPASLHSLIISFLEDWASGVSWLTPYPEGHEFAGELLQKLLPVAKEGWRDNSEKHRVLAHITKTPKSAEATFKDLVQRRKHLTRRRDDIDAEIFGEFLQKPFNAIAAARDFPEETIELCRAIWKSKQGDDNDCYSGFRDVESVFGIGDHIPHKFFPASALQGPFKWLLQFHPRTAIQFIISLLNNAADHYGNGISKLQYVEGPEQIELHFSDGKSSNIWANARLWNAYRGTSVMPCVLGSGLMALEAWLLEMIQLEEFETTIQKWLVWILQNSNNVAPIAVVASVCIAYPGKTIDASVIILGCRDFFALDRQRMVADHNPLAPGGLGYIEREMQKERIASNKLLHRRHDLERLAIDTQLIDRDKIWAILDAYNAALPPQGQQGDDDRLWRLALCRMDLRQHEIAAVADDGRVQIQMRKLDPDVQEVIDRGAPELDQYNRSIGLFLWANTQYEKSEKAAEAKHEWRIRLQQAQEEINSLVDQTRLGAPSGGPGIVAAVCVRDHWDELTDQERQWCVEVVLGYVVSPPAGNDFHEFMAKNPMNGVLACANVLPLIRLKCGADPLITQGLIAALVHFNEDTRFEAAKGVSEFVVTQAPQLAAFCTWILVVNAQIWKTFEEQENKIPYHEREPFMVKVVGAAQEIERIISDEWYGSYPDLQRLGFGSWAERHLIRALIHLFRNHTELPEAFTFFSRVAHALTIWWQLDRRDNNRHEQPDFNLQYAAKDAIAAFLLDLTAEQSLELARPFFLAIEKVPDEVAKLLSSMLSYEDRRTSYSSYWELWTEIVVRVRAAPWLIYIDRDHANGRSLVRECFLNTEWKEGIQKWNRLGANFQRIDALFVQLPASTFVLQSYAHYLYHIGGDSLPNAFISIANKFGSGIGEAIAGESNIRWYLDELLSRSMFENLASLKKDGALRAAVISLLDGLVFAGSSVAFQLRDDFVTPYPLNQTSR